MKIYAILLLVFSPLSFGNERLDSLISLDIKFAEPKRFNSHVDNFEASLWPKFEPEDISTPVIWSCGIVTKDILPEKRISIEFLGVRQTWIPLSGKVKKQPIWLYTL